MRRLANRKFSTRLLVVELPILGFLLGVLFAFGFSFARSLLASINSNAEEDVLCQMASQVTREIAAISSASLPHCSYGQLSNQPLFHAVSPSISLSAGSILLEAARHRNQLRYNAVTAPPFRAESSAKSNRYQPTLDQIINGVLAHLKEQNYPTEPVSISLVDLTGTCCEYGQFQDQRPRYPASIVKLFWLVALYGHYEAGSLRPDIDLAIDDESLMAHYSNNGASSRVLDAITQTTSGASLDDAEFTAWARAREQINTYFRLANYADLNIANKTFPIPDLDLAERAGRDLQLAQREAIARQNQSDPLALAADRNYLSTLATARLLYEIETGQAISKQYSDRAKAHLQHSTDPQIWQFEEFNAIEGFFGEDLPADVELYTKLGFTFDDGRQEAAIIKSPDGRTQFILVVFANDSIYSQENKVFPEIARYVYDQMILRSR